MSVKNIAFISSLLLSAFLVITRSLLDEDCSFKNKVKHYHDGKTNPEAEGAAHIHHQLKQSIGSHILGNLHLLGEI